MSISLNTYHFGAGEKIARVSTAIVAKIKDLYAKQEVHTMIVLRGAKYSAQIVNKNSSVLVATAACYSSKLEAEDDIQSLLNAILRDMVI